MIKHIFILFIVLTMLFYLVNYYLKNTILENYTGLITDDFYENVQKNNYKIDKKTKEIIFCDADNNCTKKSYINHFNTPEGTKLTINKTTTSKILNKHNVPVPKFTVINIKEDEAQVLMNMDENNITFPIVLKPIDGTFGIDVITNIETVKELKSTLEYFRNKKRYRNIMLEEQIEGDVYRIFVFNNQVIDIVRREKPYIITNGVNTIQELIDMRNEDQVKKKLFKTKNISENYLKKQGYKLSDRPKKGLKIFITDIINMHNGAIISKVDLNQVPVENIEMFIKVNKALGITCSGIDYLSKDVTVHYNKNYSKVLEVNGRPDTEIHTKLEDSSNPSFFKKIAGSIF
jgi:D-alanine-D-alanine ligase-like ATP-grasp enzyme